nr:hypothetical protein BFBNJELC_00001 [uncultured bacterium]
MGRRDLLALHIHPCVTVIRLSNGVWDHFDVFLNDVVLKTTTDQAFNRIQCIFRIGHGLTFCRLPHQRFAIISKRYDGRRGSGAFRVFNNTRLITFKNRNTGVGRPKVDTNNLAHFTYPYKKFFNDCQLYMRQNQNFKARLGRF